MKFKYALFIALVTLISATSFAQVTITGSFVYQSLSRNYRLYVPAIYNSSVPVPLVLNLHGYSSNSAQQEAYGDFRPIADTANFLVVCPNGTLDATNLLYWNCFDVPGGPDDVGFLNALIDTISAHYSIDQNRIYSTGMSNGGFMSYELARQLSNRIAAIASVTGDMIYSHMNSCYPIHPMPAMQIHGTADGTVAYNGDVNFEPIDSLVKFWVNFNHCNSTPTFTALPDINTTDNCTAEHYVYSGGDSSTTVEFYKIIGGDHSWPGAPLNINTTNMDFKASVEIWRFFSQYRLSDLSNGVTENEMQISIPAYPNPSNATFNLNFPNEKVRTITVTDCFGKLIQKTNCTTASFQFSMENSGIYFITVFDGEKSFTQKVIKE